MVRGRALMRDFNQYVWAFFGEEPCPDAIEIYQQVQSVNCP